MLYTAALYPSTLSLLSASAKRCAANTDNIAEKCAQTLIGMSVYPKVTCSHFTEISRETKHNIMFGIQSAVNKMMHVCMRFYALELTDVKNLSLDETSVHPSPLLVQ